MNEQTITPDVDMPAIPASLLRTDEDAPQFIQTDEDLAVDAQPVEVEPVVA